MNAVILEHIQLVCFGSTFGIDLKHLEHLQSNNNSKMLGFDVNASLRLTMSGVQDNPSNLELPSHWLDFLQQSTLVDEQFAIVNSNGTCCLQESRYYTPLPQNLTEVDLRTRGRVNALASLLQQPKEQVFRIPRCIGWSFIPQRSQIAFLFEIPKGSNPQPSTLLKLLDNPDLKLPLGKKFNLAHGLARCIAQLHMVRWVSFPVSHNTIRSLAARFQRCIEASSQREIIALLSHHSSRVQT